MATIRDIIRLAYGELGIADYVFDLGPDEDIRAKTQLEAMLAEWAADGARVGYSSAGLSDESNVPAYAITGLYAALALRLAPGLGKVPAPETQRAAQSGIATIFAKVRTPLKRYPTGYAGAASWNNNTQSEPERLWIGGDILEL